MQGSFIQVLQARLGRERDYENLFEKQSLYSEIDDDQSDDDTEDLTEFLNGLGFEDDLDVEDIGPSIEAMSFAVDLIEENSLNIDEERRICVLCETNLAAEEGNCQKCLDKIKIKIYRLGHLLREKGDTTISDSLEVLSEETKKIKIPRYKFVSIFLRVFGLLESVNTVQILMGYLFFRSTYHLKQEIIYPSITMVLAELMIERAMKGIGKIFPCLKKPIFKDTQLRTLNSNENRTIVNSIAGPKSCAILSEKYIEELVQSAEEDDKRKLPKEISKKVSSEHHVFKTLNRAMT